MGNVFKEGLKSVKKIWIYLDREKYRERKLYNKYGCSDFIASLGLFAEVKRYKETSEVEIWNLRTSQYEGCFR